MIFFQLPPLRQLYPLIHSITILTELIHLLQLSHSFVIRIRPFSLYLPSSSLIF
nr:MAG TPA: hypothetical protein [Bacteriophage sp.]